MILSGKKNSILIVIVAIFSSYLDSQLLKTPAQPTGLDILSMEL